MRYRPVESRKPQGRGVDSGHVLRRGGRPFRALGQDELSARLSEAVVRAAAPRAGQVVARRSVAGQVRAVAA